MTALHKLRETATLFASHGIEDAAKEAETLITEVCSVNRTHLYAHHLRLSTDQCSLINSLAARRLKGEPLQYVIGHIDFLGLTVHVGPGVLIPRPETELLAEEAVARIRGESGLRGSEAWGTPLRILDLCTGSGCVALALAKRFPVAFVVAVDRSAEAVRYALLNAEKNGVRNVHFILGDLFSPFRAATFDYVVSNPPYVPSGEIPCLQREVREHEPVDALDGGPDGLDFYRRILTEAPRYLRHGGRIFLEIGIGQKNAIEAIARAEGFQDVTSLQDYSGIWRIFSAKHPGR
jgi:release factor glutamine methyltransferase